MKRWLNVFHLLHRNHPPESVSKEKKEREQQMHELEERQHELAQRVHYYEIRRRLAELRRANGGDGQ